MPSPPPQDYFVFGLRVRSAIPLPELFTVEGDAAPDVVIDEGRAPAVDSESPLVATDGGLLLNVPEVARYFVRDGRTITVDAEPGVPHRNLRLFLLGSAFGALLHQRGLLPLHANAVAIDGRAFAFMGHSGAGKSTLAAWFHDNGYRVLADDVCVVRFDGQGRPLATPGLPRLRLWADAIELTGREQSDFDRSYVGAAAELEKFDVPIGAKGDLLSDTPFGAIYLLGEARQFNIERLKGVEAAQPIFENTYRGAYVPIAGKDLGHWTAAVSLAQTAPVFRLERSMELPNFASECEAILAHARQVPATV